MQHILGHISKTKGKKQKNRTLLI